MSFFLKGDLIMERVSILERKMIEYNAPDMKRINHALKVTAFSSVIAAGEKLSKNDKLLLLCSAALHDIGIHKAEKLYNSSSGQLQEKLGPEIASQMIMGLGFTKSERERICFLIGHHHTYTIKNDLLLQILIEADFIVNIDEGDFPEGTSYEMIKEKNFKTKTGIDIFEKLILADKN